MPNYHSIPSNCLQYGYYYSNRPILQHSIPLPALALSAPARLKRGQSGQLGLSFSASTPAAAHVFHVDVVDPAGKIVPYYSGNVLALGGRADRILPLASSDQTGNWMIRVKDLLTGQSQSKSVQVSE